MRYDDTSVPGRYHQARMLSPSSMELWSSALTRNVPVAKVNSIVDLGSGTGRFTEMLATHFIAEVKGVEPSEKMREQAASMCRTPGIRFIDGQADAIPCDDNSVDMIFMSMVYHHIKDTDAAHRELARVIRSGGYFCVRNYTEEAVAHLPYLQYFPTAAEVEDSDLPSRSEFISSIGSAGFELVAHEVVQQAAADSPRAYLDKIELRAYSDLASISDDEFDSGMSAMREGFDLSGDEPVREPVDLFVFRKN